LRALLADFIGSIVFMPNQYDRDAWMQVCESDDGYDCIYTYVDDFKVVAKDPKEWDDTIEAYWSQLNHQGIIIAMTIIGQRRNVYKWLVWC